MYTHCLLFTDTEYGCTVQMATMLDASIIDHDLSIKYTSALLMIEDFQYLYCEYATDAGLFNYPATQLYDVLMGAY